MDVHTWFNLTYCSYLTLPRSILQAMPEEWQERFIALVSEIEETLEYEGSDATYTVHRRDDKGRFVPDPLSNYRYPPPIIKRRDGQPIGVCGYHSERKV